MGPFPSSYGNKYTLLAVDYVSKWVEAIASPTNDARVVTKLFKKKIFPRFGTPRVLISDEGQHILEKRFEGVLKKYGVYHKIGLGYHPQTSGQAEINNREIKSILEKTVARLRKDWANKLDDSLWANRTTFKTPIGTTPYKLVHGKLFHLPVELEHIAFWVIKAFNYDLLRAGEKRLLDINKLDEIRLDAYENSRLYKEKIERWHDKDFIRRSFEVRQLVLLFNSRLKLFPGKLKSRWTGPFKSTRVFFYGSIELLNAKGETFKHACTKLMDAGFDCWVEKSAKGYFKYNIALPKILQSFYIHSSTTAFHSSNSSITSTLVHSHQHPSKLGFVGLRNSSTKTSYSIKEAKEERKDSINTKS
ncbi:uncharacterized protein LOC130810733 [Amaranthus tricolor]|uniref:uncharacterized protein LOC130810733 n=1 Tax=Amaranthus tricolor TaxID=29722 RepID=UPI002585CD35|nr:uncharacterized protein LOC130810733 [Amaranthus tricolor]